MTNWPSLLVSVWFLITHPRRCRYCHWRILIRKDRRGGTTTFICPLCKWEITLRRR